MLFQNGSNKVVIELRVVQFWSEIILVISNRTHAARWFDFEITRMISDQIALHSVQLPLYIQQCSSYFFHVVFRTMSWCGAPLAIEHAPLKFKTTIEVLLCSIRCVVMHSSTK